MGDVCDWCGVVLVGTNWYYQGAEDDESVVCPKCYGEVELEAKGA